MDTLAIDIETYSDVSLPDCGVHRYAASEQFEILLFAYSLNDEPTRIIDLASGQTMPDEIMECPVFYYKKDMELDIRGIRTGKMRKRKCFVYIMHEERKIGIPSLSYVRTCLEGYISFGFDEHYLSEAQIRAVKEAGYED